MTDEAVLYEVHDGVAVLTLNRPERLNAWNGELEKRYFALLAQASDDADVKVIVVRGAGKGWCAGADMDLLQGIGQSGGTGGGGTDQSNEIRARQIDTMKVPKPVIAAINGACAGIGLVQAAMCDLRFAAAGAKFTTAFARRGLVAEYGLSWILPRLIGPSRALDLLMSGRVFLAEEALELGFVNKVVAPDKLMDETLAYAADLATNSSPQSMAAMKMQVYAHLDMSVDDAFTHSTGLMGRSLKEQDFKEGVASFMEKRPPAFQPLTKGWATGE